jgi:outer membrane protein assembly factor BamA
VRAGEILFRAGGFLCYSFPIMKRTFFLLLTAVVLLASSFSAAAQKFQPKTIQFKGAPEYSDQELMAAAGLKTGTVLDYSEMKEHSQKLMDTGVFESLAFKFDGVDLIYTLVPHTDLYPIRLKNLPLTPGKELDAALHDRFPLYHGKVPAENGMLEGVRGALEEMLAAKGIKATVTATPYTDEKLYEVTAMSFSITAPRVKVGELRLEGVTAEMQAKVKSVADRVMKADYDTEKTAGNMESAFASFYVDEGYAAVKVHAERSGDPVAGSETIDVPFDVTIEEGRHYTLGSIIPPSGEPLTMAEINNAAGAISYKSGGLSETLSAKGGLTLRTAVSFVMGQYRSKGYMDCVVTPHPQFDEAAGIVNYTLEVQPGPVYTMGKLTIENTADDLRAAMLTAWKLSTGAVFDESALRSYFGGQDPRSALGQTFASANCIYKLTRDNEAHTVNVSLRLEKKQ